VKQKPITWQKAFEAASRESKPTKQRVLCESARQLIHERLIAIADSKNHLREERSLEEALRKLWAIEHKVPNSPKRARRKRSSKARR
jgi:hypothetical protein